MYPINKEYGQYLHSFNIRVSDLNASSTMSQPPRKVIQMPKIRMLRGGRASSSIKITNVKSIKPPDPEILKKQEEESLRAQLQKEIVSRSRTCAHRGYECTQTVLTGHSYCARHILNDPTAPYKQCAHVFGNGQRCPMVAPDDTREHRDQGLCFEHARMALSSRQRSAAPPPPVTTTETLLNQLQHYIRPGRTRTTSCASSVSVVSDPIDQEQVSTNPVDPFKQIDATSVNATVSAAIMECASDSDSDNDSVTVGEGGDCRGGCDHDSEHEDTPAERMPLWHAGVLTAEEAVREARTVLRTLQSAYAQQMGRLRERLCSARAHYLRSLRSERELYCSINTQSKSGPLTVRERQQLRKLKAYASFHRRHGVEAVLARKLHRKRARVGEVGLPRPVPPQARCTFAEGGVRCERGALPAAKHCLKHILLDRHQVLFSACAGGAGAGGGVACREVVARLPLPSTLCRYHSGTAPYLYHNQKKEESEAGSHSTTDESQLEHIEDGSTERSSPADDNKVEVETMEPMEPMETMEPMEPMEPIPFDETMAGTSPLESLQFP